jgi:hypothetical protein
MYSANIVVEKFDGMIGMLFCAFVFVLFCWLEVEIIDYLTG